MTSVVDQPAETRDGESLGTGVYAAALTQFIEDCQTPLTIGVQGEWGSGKTSILNMIREKLIEKDKDLNLKDAFKIIWINTWEHSVLKTPEETLISIINEIIDSVSEVDGKWSSAAKAKQALQGVVKGVARVGVSYVAGAAAADAVQDSFEATNSVKKLRTTLKTIIEETAESNKKNSSMKFVIFVDDLDRLDPPVAVKVLELLKNIFDLKRCVFVLAIDYQVVVKGLKEKFGEPSEDNEWEFRAFFDKIIQLPFMMPMASYNHTNYLANLLEPIKFLDGQTLNSISKRGEESWLTNIVRFCIGYNPRSMKRLTNSLSMVKLLANSEDFKQGGENFKNTRLKNTTLCLVCLQIAFPKVFELLMRKPGFLTGWDDDFMKSVTRPNYTEALHNEAKQALEAAYSDVSDDWDEEWERNLFLIVWINGWQRNKLTEISRVLSIIKDNKQLLGSYTNNVDNTESESDEFIKVIEEALTLASVTSVAAADVLTVSSSGKDKNDDENVYKECRADFWKLFIENINGSGSVFDPSIKKWKGQSKVSSSHIIRQINNLPWLEVVVRVNQRNPLELRINESLDTKGVSESILFSHSDKIINALSETDVTIDRENKKITIAFPEKINDQFVKGECSFFLTTAASTQEKSYQDRSVALRGKAIDWLVEKLIVIENIFHNPAEQSLTSPEEGSVTY